MSGGLILAGDVKLGFFDSSGAFLGYAADSINVTELTPTPGEGEQRDRVSRMRDTFGQALDSITLPAPWTLTFTTDSISRDILRGLFLGLDEEVAVASGAVTDEAVAARHDKWVPLANQNILATPAPTVTGAGGTPTYNPGTDYEIDRRNGQIRAFGTGAIADAAAIEVDYSYGGKAGFRINAAQAESLQVAMLLDGRSLRPEDANKTIRWVAPRVNIRPAGGNDLKGDEWLAPQFSGTFITPPGESQPFFYEEYVAGE